MKKLILLGLIALSPLAFGQNHDLLIQMAPQVHSAQQSLQSWLPQGTQIENLKVQNWHRIQVPPTANAVDLSVLAKHPQILHVQPNFKVTLYNQPSLEKVRQSLRDGDNPFPFPFPGDGDDGDFPFPFPGDGDGGGFPFPGDGNDKAMKDNPPLPKGMKGGSGDDPLYDKQWGMVDSGMKDVWKTNKGNKDFVVAVIDTGVDYNHEDLTDNIWRNPGETGMDANGNDKATNGVDDDQNGYVDDVVGWDFVSNDNKPWDLSKSGLDLLQGGNPGHGTHCAGNVAATGFNGKGISGVAPNVKIMVLRFLSEKGSGTTADAIKSIRYAVDNGARITNNSWGSEGENPNDSANNKALRDAIQYSQDKGVLFVAAAGNGRQGRGYNNDTDSKPAYPASYPHDIIISVAAIDKNDAKGSFSNWGQKTVDIGAPGVAVFSTMVKGKYSDLVLDIFGIKATWDGTSMAAPHVAGAAALYWSANPNKTWREVKEAVLNSATSINAMSGKSVSGGKLNVTDLMK